VWKLVQFWIQLRKHMKVCDVPKNLGEPFISIILLVL
jgi:hypothetical protein